jgi:hypothetical protein
VTFVALAIEGRGRRTVMSDRDLTPHDSGDVQVLRAQGVLAELLGVDLEQAAHGLRTYATLSGQPVHTVVQQVCDRELTISYGTCVSDGAAGRRSTSRRHRDH